MVITEGELKTIAMRRLAIEGTRTPRFLVIGLSGIWNYIATVGTVENENGVRVPVKGFSPELDLIKWIGRNVIIIFDSDAVVKDDVRKHAGSSRLSCGSAVPTSDGSSGIRT